MKSECSWGCITKKEEQKSVLTVSVNDFQQTKFSFLYLLVCLMKKNRKVQSGHSSFFRVLPPMLKEKKLHKDTPDTQNSCTEVECEVKEETTKNKLYY